MMIHFMLFGGLGIKQPIKYIWGYAKSIESLKGEIKYG
jgi:hypothetical protein